MNRLRHGSHAGCLPLAGPALIGVPFWFRFVYFLGSFSEWCLRGCLLMLASCPTLAIHLGVFRDAPGYSTPTVLVTSANLALEKNPFSLFRSVLVCGCPASSS